MFWGRAFGVQHTAWLGNSGAGYIHLYICVDIMLLGDQRLLLDRVTGRLMFWMHDCM